MSTAISHQDLRRLSSGRWLIPLLAAMAREPGSRFGALARQLPISRSMLSASLEALARFGWIQRNPGHGHPLRPEYLLTPEGRRLADWSATVMEQRERLKLEQRAFGRWSLPLLQEVGSAPKLFTQLERALSPISPRALSLSLQQMQQVDLVGCRDSHYALTGRGRRFACPLLLT